MQVRVLTLKYSEGQQGFPEEALHAATFGRDVLSVDQHFFVHGGMPHLTLVLTLGDYVEQTFRGRDPQAPDPETELPEGIRAVYRDLKRWRNETAKAEGRPAYAIARNRQLAEIVLKVPQSLSALKEIEGLGSGFTEKYGQTVLDLIASIKHEPLESSKPPEKTHKDGELNLV